MHNYYDILNVSSSSSKNEIKKAYRKQALKWHPDRNSHPDSTERMQLVNEAYLVLKDSEARARYDKEYQRYCEFIINAEIKGAEQSHKHYRSSNTGAENQYDYQDKELKDWIDRARRKASQLVKQSIEDVVGMSKAASSSAWDATKWHILLLIVLIVVFRAVGLI